jgi:hypothetical protein
MILLLILTIASLLVAVVMSVVAWRTASEERRRSNARVAALAADIHDSDFDLRSNEPEQGRELAPIGDLFAAAQPVQSGSRFAIVVACGVIVVGSLATLGLLLSRGSPHVSAATTASQTTPAGLTNPAPLELVALGHERTGDDLTVRGIVRNPSSGIAVERLTAVVFLFNREGGFLTSGRATVESPALVPGGESRFVVTVPSAGEVGRYRVSFRTDDRVVPHVDRREPALARR